MESFVTNLTPRAINVKLKIDPANRDQVRKAALSAGLPVTASYEDVVDALLDQLVRMSRMKLAELQIKRRQPPVPLPSMLTYIPE